MDLSGLGSVIGGFNQGRQQMATADTAEINVANEKAKQAGMAAYFRALQSLTGGNDLGGMPQPPMPGQSSQPAAQPVGGAGFQTPGGLMTNPSPIAMGGAPAAPPMPQAPQQPMQAPQMGGARQPLTWQAVVQALKQSNPGMSDLALAAAVDHAMPLLTMESRLQWQQLRNELILELGVLRSDTSRANTQDRTEAQRYGVDTRSETSRRGQDIRSDTQRYGVDVRSADYGERTQAQREAEQGRGERATQREAGLDRRNTERVEGAFKRAELSANARREVAKMSDQTKREIAAAVELGKMDRAELSAEARAEIAKMSLNGRRELTEYLESGRNQRAVTAETGRNERFAEGEAGRQGRTNQQLATRTQLARESEAGRQGRFEAGEAGRQGRFEESEAGRNARTETLEAGRENRSAAGRDLQREALTQRQSQFEQREARLTEALGLRQDQNYQRLEIQKRSLEERIRSGQARESITQWRALVDAQHKLAMEKILSAGPGMMPPKERQELVKTQNAWYNKQIEDMRSIAGRSTGGATETGATPTTPKAQERAGAPQPGAVKDGFRFKGGDPGDQKNWEPVS